MIGDITGGVYAEKVGNSWIVHESCTVREPTEFELLLIDENTRLRDELRRPLSRGAQRELCEQCGDQKQGEIDELRFNCHKLQYQLSNLRNDLKSKLEDI